MSNFHIIYKLRIDIETDKGVEKVEWPFPKYYLSDLRTLIDSELHHYTMNWIRRIFLVGKLEVISCGYNPNDQRYHSWLTTKDSTNISIDQLSKALHFVKPENGKWYKEESKILNKPELDELNLVTVRLVPLVEKVLVVTENMVDLSKIPDY